MLACKNWTSHLECLQPHIPMCTYNWSYFEVLNHRIHDVSLRLKKKILCLKAAARICFSVRIWFWKIQTCIFFSWNYYFFFHFYYEKRRKFAVLEEFKHVGAQKTCKIPFDFWKYGSWDFSVIFGFGCAWRQRPIEVKKNKIRNKKTACRVGLKNSRKLWDKVFFFSLSIWVRIVNKTPGQNTRAW